MTKTKSQFTMLIAAAVFTVLNACATYANSKDAPLTDANIAAIVVGANKIDISAAEIALDKSENPEIREFAALMIEDHNAVLNAAVDLATRLGVVPVNNDLVKSLSEQAAEHESRLKSLSGIEFDKAYIDHEVVYHEAVIGVINDLLIPGASNAELKDTLISVVPAFNAHLEHSKMVAGKL